MGTHWSQLNSVKSKVKISMTSPEKNKMMIKSIDSHLRKMSWAILMEIKDMNRLERLRTQDLNHLNSILS